MSALIWCPFPDEDTADQAARQLIAEKLVACINILPPIRSIYLWQGDVHEAAEVGAVFKTDASLLALATARLAELHPYETPAVMGWRTDTAARPTAEWLRELVR